MLLKKLPKIFKSACKLTAWTLLDQIMPKEAFSDGWSHLICTIYCIYQQDLLPLLQTFFFLKNKTPHWEVGHKQAQGINYHFLIQFPCLRSHVRLRMLPILLHDLTDVLRIFRNHFASRYFPINLTAVSLFSSAWWKLNASCPVSLVLFQK